MRVKVKAVERGYYEHKRRKIGEKFTMDVDALKFAKVKNHKGVEVDAVIFPSWVKLLETPPPQSELKKALNDFQNKRKLKKSPVLPEALIEDENEESDDDSSDSDDQSPADLEVI